MTTEVVIGNGFGVVLCADSVTTVGNRRTFEGARKILGLPQPHAIGVLHSGIVNFHGVAYETLLESWIHSLPDQRLGTVEDYRESFLKHLAKNLSSIDTELDLARLYLREFRNRLHRRANWLRRENKLTDVAIAAFYTDLIADYDEEQVAAAESWAPRVLEILGQGSRKNIVEQDCADNDCTDTSHASIEGAIEATYGSVASAETLEIVLQWSRLFLGLYHPVDSEATLAFVGYGARDLLPSLATFDIEGAFLGKVFYNSPRTRSCIKRGEHNVLFDTFGQDFDIWRLIREGGEDPNYSKKLISRQFDNYAHAENSATVEPGAEEILTLVEGGVGDEGATSDDHRSERTAADIEALHTLIEDEFDAVATENVDRTLSTFGGLNLYSLTSLAQRLVGVQSLSLDLRSELPTVGGQVTTAVITPQHGFRQEVVTGASDHWWIGAHA